jgi:hypothetical protein
MFWRTYAMLYGVLTMLSSECPMPSMGGVYREGRGAILRITLYASYQVPPSHLLATFVVTCTARIYLPSLLHACTHTFTTSRYTSNYLVCILPGCQPSIKEASYLKSFIVNRASSNASPFRLRATRTALTTDQ